MWQESILLLGIALVLAIVIKAFFVQAFYIPSESMEPGLVKDDRILVEKWSYWGGADPERGDVVVFEDPGNWLGADASAQSPGTFKSLLEKVGLYPAGGHLVKRVVGIAGDTIKCCDDQGRISVNGVPLNEPYLKNAARCNGPMIGCHWTAGPVPSRPHLRDGRPPRQLGGLVVPHVQTGTDRLRPGGRVRPGGPRRRQGVRARVAA